MKKFLVVALSVALLLSTTACGTNSELEALKQANEQLKSHYQTQESRKNQLKSQLKNQPKNRLKNQRNKKLQILKPNSDNSYEFTAGNYELPCRYSGR